VSAWEEQALPILRVLKDPQDPYLRDGVLSVGRGEGARALQLEIDEGALFETLFQLRDLRYVEFSDPEYDFGRGASFSDLRITGRGLQVLGEWPRFGPWSAPRHSLRRSTASLSSRRTTSSAHSSGGSPITSEPKARAP
jgi:hypothetical protein